jgi:hypothetical protein
VTLPDERFESKKKVTLLWSFGSEFIYGVTQACKVHMLTNIDPSVTDKHMLQKMGDLSCVEVTEVFLGSLSGIKSSQ